MNLQEIDEIIDRVKRLSGVIRDMRDRIENSRSSFQNSETTTRYQLIDPVLDELGWDVRNNKLVVPEYTVSGGRVDYALMHDGSPIAVVEAKSLSRTLDDSVTVQVLSYITDESTIKYAIATNGDSWQMRVKGERNKTVDIRIAGSSDYETALEMMRISRAVLQPDEEKMIAPVAPPIIDVAISSPEPMPESPTLGKPNNQGNQDGWFPLTELKRKWHNPKPSKIRFGDSTEVEVELQKEFFIEIVSWLARETDLKYWSKLPKGPDKVISSDENTFKPPGREQLPNGMYLQTSRGWEVKVDVLNELFSYFKDCDTGSVYVKFNRPPVYKD